MELGLIHLYCGDGKGKTSAALGLILRAAGSGFRIVFTQFMKSLPTSELVTLSKIGGITILRGDIPAVFSWDMSTEQKAQVKAEHNRLFQMATSCCEDGLKTLLVLDEIVGACDTDLIDCQAVLDFLHNKPDPLEIALTGRNPDKTLIQCADYVSEIKKVKHPFDRGIKARQGIEW